MKFFTVNMPISVQGKWFKPLEQYEILREEIIPLVNHETHNGWPLEKEYSSELHYVVLIDGVEYVLPARSGVVFDKVIPPEHVNKFKLHYEEITDGIKDYVKAAKKYLNIDIRYRPETSQWYRDQFPKRDTRDKKVGNPSTKETRYNARNEEDSL